MENCIKTEQWIIFYSLKQDQQVDKLSVIFTCNISWGLTCALKLRGFQIFLISSPNLLTANNKKTRKHIYIIIVSFHR